MTLFTKRDCVLCDQLKDRFNLGAMKVSVEVLDDESADTLAHLAWHGLVETARKQLPLLVLDDSTNIIEFHRIEEQLADRASLYGLSFKDEFHENSRGCGTGSCSL